METRNVDAYAQMHRDQSYGTTAVRMRRYIEPWVQLAKPATLLDYGAGQGRFGSILEAPSVVERHLFDAGLRDLALGRFLAAQLAGGILTPPALPTMAFHSGSRHMYASSCRPLACTAACARRCPTDSSTA